MLNVKACLKIALRSDIAGRRQQKASTVVVYTDPLRDDVSVDQSVKDECVAHGSNMEGKINAIEDKYSLDIFSGFFRQNTFKLHQEAVEFARMHDKLLPLAVDQFHIADDQAHITEISLCSLG